MRVNKLTTKTNKRLVIMIIREQKRLKESVNKEIINKIIPRLAIGQGPERVE